MGIRLKLLEKHVKIIGWIANIVTIIGVTLTSFDVYPLNIAVLSLACLIWVVTGMLWRRPELWTLNAIIFCIYIYGLLK